MGEADNSLTFSEYQYNNALSQLPIEHILVHIHHPVHERESLHHQRLNPLVIAYSPQFSKVEKKELIRDLVN